MEKIQNPCMRPINWSDGEGELNKIKKCKLKIKTKMLYVKHKKIFVKNFKSNIYFFSHKKHADR